jgi:vitamin B12 transporter
MNRIIYTYLSFVLVVLQSIVYAQNKTSVYGRVTDSQNKPLPFANVFIVNSGDGAMTGDDGTFSFSTKQKGEVTITASMIGYISSSQKINLDPKQKTLVNLSLDENAVKLKEAIVTASSYGSEKDKGVVVTRMDVLTTPGGAADIYQALKTLPGVTQVSESAELYVRGGDPIETITIIDQAVVYHTVTFESGYGGLFSNLNQNVVKSMFFTSGGFSAKYGNALSGVLDIETRNIPDQKNFNIGLSMANASLTAELPIIENKFGGYFDIRQNFTKPIFWLNGGGDRLVEAPSSKSATGALIYSYSQTGKIKLFGVYADDAEGVNVERAEYNGTFNGDSKNIFVNLQNSMILSGKLLMKNCLSYNHYSNLWRLGVLDLTKTDHVYDFRNDFEYTINSNSKFLAGAEYENRIVNYEGKIPYDDYNIRPDASSNIIDASLRGTRWGVYSEYQSLNPFDIDGLTFTGGIRFDKFPKLNLEWTDPRLSIGYKLSAGSVLCFGWGIFHQIPDPRLFAPVDGNPDLGPMKATHYIASYELSVNDQNSFRIELYHKDYKNLPLEKEGVHYDNSGYGFADGVDIIFKENFLYGITGWISYGFVNTKRLWMDFDKYTSSNYDVTHNLTLVAKYNLSENWQVGLTAKFATGRPYTPVVSALFNSQKNIYEPVYAGTNSDRFPNYKRVDLRLTYFGQLFSQLPFVAYMEGLNILDFTNIFGYSYSPDYSSRKEIKSYFGYRMIVIGFSLGI